MYCIGIGVFRVVANDAITSDVQIYDNCMQTCFAQRCSELASVLLLTADMLPSDSKLTLVLYSVCVIEWVSECVLVVGQFLITFLPQGEGRCVLRKCYCINSYYLITMLLSLNEVKTELRDRFGVNNSFLTDWLMLNCVRGQIKLLCILAWGPYSVLTT